MAVTESQVVATELERVVPKIRVLFERDPGFAGRIKKKDVEKISARQMRVPLEISPGGNFTYFNPNGGDLGRGSGPIWDKAVLTPVYMSLGIEYTKLAQWATDDARKAVQNAVRRLTATALEEYIRQLNSQIQGDGTGTIGTIGTVTAGAGGDVYVCNTDGYGVRLMRDQQVIQVFDSTYATLRGSGQITVWDVVNQSVTLGGVNIAGATTGDKIVTSGIGTPSSVPGLYGVQYNDSNASTGDWLGFNRATTPQIRASRVNGGAAALSLPLPRLAINQIGNRLGSNNQIKPSAWMHPCQKQAYEEIGQLVSQIFKEPKTEKLNMYFDGMQMAGAPVMGDDFNWNMKRIDFISEDNWGWGETLPIGFYMTDGRKIFEIRSASGGVAAADIFYMTSGRQSYSSNPAGISYIDNLAIPTGYQV